jgi:hypothetical protein
VERDRVVRRSEESDRHELFGSGEVMTVMMKGNVAQTIDLGQGMTVTRTSASCDSDPFELRGGP